MLKLKVKWGKETLDVDVDTASPPSLLKAQLQSLTGVPADKQKIMGVKGGQLKDDADLRTVGLSESKPLMLIGTAEAAPSAPTTLVTFDEDRQGGISAAAPTTNGLVNVGNTCYMNSALQLLRQVPEIRPVLSLNPTVPLNQALLRLFETLDGTKDAVPPLPVWLALMTAFPNFAETDDHGHPMQHDAQEALASFLQGPLQSAQSDARYGHLLHGSMSTQVSRVTTSADGDKVLVPLRNESSPFTILPCNISGEAQTLEAGLEQAMTETIVAASEDGGELTLEKKSQFETLPEYLLVHLVRFHWRKDINKKTKVLKPITFPLVLDVFSLCSDTLKHQLQPKRDAVKLLRDAEVERRKRSKQKSGHDETAEPENAATTGATTIAEKEADSDEIPLVYQNDNGFYELCAVISHKGRSADGGHYIAWILKAGTWLVVDDHNVAAVSEEDVRRLRGVGEAHIAYVLLYRSRAPGTGALPLLL